jgi:hypothetical protein
MSNCTGNSATGQAVAAVIHSPGRNSPRPPATPALVILNADGFFELYSDSLLRVLVVQRLDVAPQEEILADDLLTARLPQAFKNLYWPSKRRAIGQCRRVTPDDRIDTLARLAALRDIQELSHDGSI